MKKNEIFNFPNYLTFSRMASTLVLLYFWFYANFFSTEYIRIGVLLLVYIAAVLTDYFDGYYARKLKIPTSFGKFFDPLADKIFILSIFFAYFYIPALGIWIWPVVLITMREVVITILRVYCSVKSITMATEMHGKLKTVVQITAQIVIWLILFLYALIFESNLFYNFLQEMHLQMMSLHFYQLPFYVYEEFLVIEMQATWGPLILEQLPNVLVLVCMAITVYSGAVYLFRNGHVFKKNASLKNK